MFLWLKTAHVLSVVVFLGNIITGLFWHSHALRTRDQALVRHAIDGVIRSDRWFTLPGVFLIILTGVGAAMSAGYPILGTRWILWSLVLFAVSGVAFVSQVAPIQKRLQAMAGEPGRQFSWDAYLALTKRWEWWGAVALVTPLAALALMVFKPA